MDRLKNVMEQTVLQVIDKLAEDQEFCNCHCCRMDIAALALNSLPPRYVITSKGETYSHTDLLELQKSLDVVSAVFRAIKIVQKNPRHGD